MRILRSLVLVPLLLALACTPGPGEEPSQPSAGGAGAETAAAQQPAAGTASEDPNVAKPAAELEGECRPRPTAQGDLVANLQVVNTGNIGVVVRVATKWPLAGGGGLNTWDRVRVEAGETLPVTLRLRLDRREAQRVATAVNRGRTCNSGRRILGAFGVPGG